MKQVTQARPQKPARKAAPAKGEAEPSKHLARSGAQAGTPAPEAPIVDMDKFRNDMAQRLSIIIGDMKRAWRRCPERPCRRARRCLSPRILCSVPMVGPPPSAERIARTKAQLHRILIEGVPQGEG